MMNGKQFAFVKYVFPGYIIVICDVEDPERSEGVMVAAMEKKKVAASR